MSAIADHDVPMLPATVHQLPQPRPIPRGKTGAPQGRIVSEPRAWGACVWTTSEHNTGTGTGTALIGTPRDTRAACRIDRQAYRALLLACALPAIVVRLSVRYGHLWSVPAAIGTIAFLAIIVSDERRDARVQRCTITPELSRLLTVETQTMAAERPDAGLLALVRAAITHPAHHTAEAADALTACATLVAATHDTPMQATTTATLDSLAAHAAHADPAMWPQVRDTATEQTTKVHTWRTAQAHAIAAIEAPTRDAHRDAARDAFAALDEQVSIETAVLPHPHQRGGAA